MKYDESLFEGTAEYYGKYRPRYPEKIFDRIIDIFQPSEDDVSLDLGCGTGEIALPLAKYFKKVLAWDPDGEMLEVAKRKAEEQGVTNVVFEQKSSDDLPTLSEKIKLVTMGQSLHWMDVEVVLSEIKKHLVIGGGVAIIGGAQHGLHIYSPFFDEPNEITAERNKIVREVVIKDLGSERKAGKSVFRQRDDKWLKFDDALAKTGFTDIDEIMFSETVKRSVDETIGFLYSTSWGNKHQLGEKVDEFEKELREKLLELQPSGVFDERVEFYFINGRRKPENEQ